MRALILLLALTLPACETQEQIAQYPARALAHDTTACNARGVASDSGSYVHCMESLSAKQGIDVFLASDGSWVLAPQLPATMFTNTYQTY